MSELRLPLDPPDGFEVAEVMVTLRGPAVDELRDARVLQRQHPIRPNLIVHRRRLPARTSLELLAGEACAELLASIEQLSNLETGPFSFADGAEGRLIQFDFSAGPAAQVRQLQALRLDGDVFSTLTLTVSRTTLTDEARARLLAALASLGGPGDPL